MFKKLTHIILILLLSGISGLSQSKEWSTVNAYRESLSLQSDYPYVNYFITKDQKPVTVYLYYKVDKRFVLALIEGGIDSVKERYYETDVLFEKIDEKLKPLIKLSTNGMNSDDYRKAMQDPSIPFHNIAIRYKTLHYNHYHPATKEQLALIKNENLVAAYETLDFIAAFFHEQIPDSSNK